MNCTIVIDARHLSAAIHLASKGDLRYYLNGVFIEATADETRVVATNGHALAVMRRDSENAMGGENFRSLIIPREVVENVNKDTKGKGHVELQQVTGGKWSIIATRASFGFVPVDGRYPNYRAAVPRELSGEASHFNPDLLLRFSKAAKALGVTDAPKIMHNGNGAAGVTLHNRSEFAGVIMPLKMHSREMFDSSWISGPLKGFKPEAIEATT